MKHTGLRMFVIRLSWILCMSFLLSGACLIGSLAVTAEKSTYIEPAYAVDFTDPDRVMSCSGIHALTVEPSEEGMVIRFADTKEGLSVDPYLTFPLPEEGISLSKYHYFAMLVRTDKQDLRGELRFKSSTTGDDYPCQFFQYEETDDWQLIVLDLTDRSTIQYCGETTPLEGQITRIRLDMFNNTCQAAETNYTVKAYGLYETREAAQTFVNFTPSGGTGGETLPDVDYASFWRGEAFAEPSLSTRMRWVSYGFKSTSSSPIDLIEMQGFGGVVSNVLFEKNYLLNDKQFEILGSVYAHANRVGMSTWIYDEYQWPSGKAFGQVLEGHDEYEATGVEHRYTNGTGGTASFACTGSDIRILRADLTDAKGTRTLTAADGLGDTSLSVAAEGRWTLHIYVLRRTYEGVENRDDFTTLRHVDLLNRDAVARFIELTHERYKNKMGESFAEVDAFFTDEPQLGNRAHTGYVVWTPGLDETFRETYGYELDLALLFGGTQAEAERMRIHFYSLVAKLFKEAYIDQISAWCEQNGTASSGHLLFEECMTDQIETYGGDFLQIIGGMTIPGVDLLWVDPGHLLSKNHIGNAVGTRYVASAAKNEGKDRVMVEFNPDAANALSDTDPLSDCIAGVSVTRLLGTTDYNVINPQVNLNMAEFRALNTYVGRLNTLLDGAIECGELAVFYPVASVQALCAADRGHTTETNDRSQAFALDTKYQNLCLKLLTAQYLYTTVDDVALQNATVASDGCLCIGDGAYRVMVLPYTEYISAKAMETLVTFRAAGGTVIFVGETPTYGLVAEDDARVAAAMEVLADAPTYPAADAFIEELSRYASRRMEVTARVSRLQSQLLVGDFSTTERDLVYMANTASVKGTYTAQYTDGYTGRVTVYYPRTGLIETAEVTADGLILTIPAYEAVLVVREDATGFRHLSDHTPYTGETPPPETESDLSTETLSPVETATETDADTAVETATGETTPADRVTDPVETDTEGGGCASGLFGGGMGLLLMAAYVACRRSRKQEN